MAKTITIIGNVASGKSTLMPILAQALHGKAVDADNLFQTSDPFSKPYLADMKRWAFANELWLTYERVKILRAQAKRNDSSIIVVDSGLLMSWVYTYSHLLVGNITDQEWQLYEDIYDEVTKDIFLDTHVLFLHNSVDILMERLKSRGRDYELAFYTHEYLGQIELGLLALQKKLSSQGVKIIEINKEEVKDFTKNSKEAENIINKVRTAMEILDD